MEHPSIGDLAERLGRLNAAIGRVRVADLTRFPAQVIQTSRVHGIFQEFSGGATPEELANDALTLVASIGSLKDHLEKWAPRNGRDAAKVAQTIRSSRDLSIIIDLWNRDKHFGPPPKGGWSKRNPRIEAIDRGLRLRSLPKKGSWVTLQSGMDGQLHRFGDGSAMVETSGKVVDGNGSSLGDLLEIALSATAAWERLLIQFEIGRGLFSGATLSD